jgi:hypothetical protein
MDVSITQQRQKFKLSHELRRLTNFIDLYITKGILENEIPQTEMQELKNKIDEFERKYLAN